MVARVEKATVLAAALCVAGVLVPAGAGAQTGTIEGLVSLQPPPRRTADRYGAGAGGAHAIQQLPAVVYLVGPVGRAGAAAEPASMVQRDTAFAPAAVITRVGGTVAFPNEDPFFHNVFSYSSPQRFDLGRYPQGESKSVTFDTPGVVSVFCEVHDFMRGAVIVTENPYHAVVAEDGTFRLTGVPAGEHTLAIWHPDHRPIERTVSVPGGGTYRIEVELRR